jgi:hypothetical protein
LDGESDGNCFQAEGKQLDGNLAFILPVHLFCLNHYLFGFSLDLSFCGWKSTLKI